MMFEWHLVCIGKQSGVRWVMGAKLICIMENPLVSSLRAWCFLCGTFWCLVAL